MKNLIKKAFLILFFLGLALATPSLTASASPNTRSGNKSPYVTATTGFEGRSCEYFLGMVSWDCGFSGDVENEEELKTGIWTIIANIATDITVIAAYLVLGYVIYGGYLYIFSAGEAGKIAAGKNTLAQAFIGLAIVMSAYIIMTAIRIALIGDKLFYCNYETGEGCANANEVVTGAIYWFISIAGIAATIYLVYGGIQYMISNGEPGKLQKAKQMITYALIGLAIVALSFSITAFVSNMIRNANTAFINQNIISKEVNEIKNV